jgi:hypothetical protein
MGQPGDEPSLWIIFSVVLGSIVLLILGASLIISALTP